MKKVLISLIKLYQVTPLSSHSMCCFIPSCSNYMIDAINEYGCIRGTYLGLKRILRCRPHKEFCYDPVPIRRKK